MKIGFENLRNIIEKEEKELKSKNKSSAEKFAYMGMPIEGRGLDDYEKKLLFNRNDLAGKDVLDLGAGPKAKFANDLKKEGINANVFSLSPHYADTEHAKNAKEKQDTNLLIAGKVTSNEKEGSSLPFKKSSFDIVFAYHVDEHIDKETSLKIILEISRTLKPGGYAKYGPIYKVPGEWDMYQEIISNENVMNILRQEDTEIKLEEVPVDIIPKQKVKDGYANAFYVPAQHIVLQKRNREEEKSDSKRHLSSH